MLSAVVALLVVVLVIFAIRLSGWRFDVVTSSKHGGKVITQEDACSLLTSTMQTGIWGNCWVVSPLIFLARTKYDELPDSVLSMIEKLRFQTDVCPLLPKDVRAAYNRMFYKDDPRIAASSERLGGFDQHLLAAFLTTLKSNPYTIQDAYDFYAHNHVNVEPDNIPEFALDCVQPHTFNLFVLNVDYKIPNHSGLERFLHKLRDINNTKLLGGCLTVVEQLGQSTQHNAHSIPYTACNKNGRPIIVCNNWTGVCGDFDPTQGQRMKYKIKEISLVTE